jgi:hypothetical protein
MIAKVSLVVLAVLIDLPVAVPSAAAVDRKASSVSLVTPADGTPVEAEVDGIVVRFTLSDAKCAIVFDGKLAVFRTASGTPPKIFDQGKEVLHLGTPYVRRAKLLGKSCTTTLEVKRTPEN